MTEKIIVITGVSCSGKSTIQSELLKRGWNKPINFTTRDYRNEDADRIDEEGDFDSEEFNEYVFIKKNQFIKKISNGDFLESTNTYGNSYGVSKYLPDGNVVIVLDPVGRAQVMEYFVRCGIEIQTYYLDINQDTQLERLKARDISEKDMITRMSDFKWFGPTNKCTRINGTLPIKEIADFINDNI